MMVLGILKRIALAFPHIKRVHTERNYLSERVKKLEKDTINMRRHESVLDKHILMLTMSLVKGMDFFSLLVVIRNIGQSDRSLAVAVLDEAKKSLSTDPLWVAYNNLEKCGRHYIINGIDYMNRSIINIVNFIVLRQSMYSNCLMAMISEKIVVYTHMVDKIEYTITLQSSRDVKTATSEGEQSLYLEANGVRVYVISFTIVPGLYVGVEDKHVILISRMQGWPGQKALHHQATKDFSDICPQAVVMAALCGIAQALGYQSVVGVSGRKQICYRQEDATLFERIYDGFFESLWGASLNAQGVYVLPVPPLEKPMQSVKPGHRLRTKAKRAFKKRIGEEVFLFWRNHISRDGDLMLTTPEDGRESLSERPVYRSYGT